MESGQTSNGKKGGLFKGKTHAEGGIKAIVVDTNEPIEVEKDEVIITAPAVKDQKVRTITGTNAEILSKINQSGGGVPIPSVHEYKYGGPIVQFNPNKLPASNVVKLATALKSNHPEIWNSYGKSFENEMFEKVKAVSGRGYWTPNEKDAFKVWQMYGFNHKTDHSLANVISMLKCGLTTDKGYPFTKQMVEQITKGVKVEKEHTKTIKKLKKTDSTIFDGVRNIAEDHLEEDSNYYTKLHQAKLKDGGPVTSGVTKIYIDKYDKTIQYWAEEQPDGKWIVYSASPRWAKRDEDIDTKTKEDAELILKEMAHITPEFPKRDVDRARKMFNAQENEFTEKNKFALGGPMATNSEYTKAVSDLDRAEKRQKMMKDTNAIIRSKKNVTERLIKEAGLSEANAIKVQEPDRYGRVGFPSYELTNNNANLKRLKDRVNMLTAKLEGAAKIAETGEVESYEFDGGTIEVNYEIDRVQILFPGGRVEKDLYRQLRSNGWVYSPTNTAFQRKITPQAISNAVYMFKAKKVGSPEAADKIKELSVSEYSAMLENRNFSYVSVYIWKAMPQNYKGDTHITLVYFGLIKPVIIDAVKTYLKNHFPEMETDKVDVSVYPKTYIKESKQLFAEGRYLPSNNAPIQVLGKKMYESLTNFFAGPTKTEEIIVEPEFTPLNSHVVSHKTPYGIDRAIKSLAINGAESEEFQKDLEIVKSNPNYNTPEKFSQQIDSEIYGYQLGIDAKKEALEKWVQRGGDDMKNHKKYKEDENEIAGYHLLIDAANKLLQIEQPKPIAEKKLLKLNRYFNGIPADTVVEVVEAPNMFVKIIKHGDKTYTVDNSYLSKVEKVAELRFPNLPANHPLNILDPSSNQYQDALKEYQNIPVSFGDLKGRRPNRSMLDELPAIGVWTEFTDDRWYRKFEFSKEQSKSPLMREMTDMGVKESTQEREDGGYDVILSANRSNSFHISDKYSEMKHLTESPTKEQIIEPNSPEDFDEAIMSNLDPNADWIGDEVRERVVKSQIYKQLQGTGTESDKSDKASEVERIFNLFVEKTKAMEKTETLGETSGGWIVEYADEEGKIIAELENQGEMTRSDAQGVLEANESFAKEQYGFGLSPSKIAEKILAKGETAQAEVAEKESVFKGINHNYKNQFVLNKAIEELLSQKAFDYTSDEKNFIKKYSGYGGLSKYGAKGKGIYFEFYTPKEVVERMWALAYKHGYNDGSILEPSIGTGEFLQFAPKNSRVVGYEISEYSAQICKLLYPTTEVIVQPFEKTFIKNNFTVKDKTDHLEKFDLVIGNPPYGDFSIVESRYMSGMGEKDHTKARNYCEYFIRRGLDLLKPDGLLVFIIGAQIKNGGTMLLDGGETPVKEYLAKNCELLEAYRLPDSVFERTGVTADILVLRKK